MITKRHLGIFFILMGTAVGALILVVNLFGLGRHPGVGPTQQIALAAAALVILVGLSLVPLGNRPA